MFNQAMQNGWLDDGHAELVNEDGVQIAPLHYPHLSHSEIFVSVEEFCRSSISAPERLLPSSVR